MKSSFAEFHPQWLGDVPSLRWSRWLPEPCLYSPFPTGHCLSSGSAPVALASAPSQAYSTRCRWIDVNVAVPSDRAILFRTITPEKLGTTVLRSGASHTVHWRPTLRGAVVLIRARSTGRFSTPWNVCHSYLWYRRTKPTKVPIFGAISGETAYAPGWRTS